MGSSTENSSVREDAEPVGPRHGPRRLERRFRRRGRRRRGTLGARLRHRRLHPSAGGALRRRRHEAHLRRRQPLWARRLRQLARPDRATHAIGLRLRPAAPAHRGPGSHAIPPASSCPRADRAARRASGSTVCASASRRSTWRLASSRACVARFDETIALVEELGGRVPRDQPAAHRVCAARLLHHRPGRGERQSGPLRRRALRLPRRGRDDLVEMYERTRGEGFGPEVKRRIMIGTYALSAGYYDAYYGRAQRVRTLVRRDFERAFADVDLIVSPTSPTVAFAAGSRSDDPLAMYMSDICTIPANLAGLPAISHPVRAERRVCRSDSSSSARRSARTACSQAAHALEGAIGFDRGARRSATPGVAAAVSAAGAGGGGHERPGSRSSGSRCTSSSTRRPRCSAAVP